MPTVFAANAYGTIAVTADTKFLFTAMAVFAALVVSRVSRLSAILLTIFLLVTLYVIARRR